MNKQDIFTGVLFVLVGAAAAIVGFILIQISVPVKEKVELCKDGWSYQNKDGRIQEVYNPEEDTCRKEK